MDDKVGDHQHQRDSYHRRCGLLQTIESLVSDFSRSGRGQGSRPEAPKFEASVVML